MATAGRSCDCRIKKNHDPCLRDHPRAGDVDSAHTLYTALKPTQELSEVQPRVEENSRVPQAALLSCPLNSILVCEESVPDFSRRPDRYAVVMISNTPLLELYSFLPDPNAYQCRCLTLLDRDLPVLRQSMTAGWPRSAPMPMPMNAGQTHATQHCLLASCLWVNRRRERCFLAGLLPGREHACMVHVKYQHVICSTPDRSCCEQTERCVRQLPI